MVKGGIEMNNDYFGDIINYANIFNIENFFDGFMIVDSKGIIRVNKQFTFSGFNFVENDSIGKTPMDVFPNLTEETSSAYLAIRKGETTLNKLQKLEYFNGGEITVLNSSMPIIKDSKIIGAITVSKFIDDNYKKNSIDLSNMTHLYNNGLHNIDDIIGSSKEIESLKYKIQKVARTNSSVLIYGETGTGKELVAQSIHSSSSRKDKCFISQNCAAIPNTLLESIFFGTTKGSYTGSIDKPGIFELADGGTIFLDEINSMDLNMQAKLLKAIEEKKVTRIGDSKSRKVDVRIIAAINETPKNCILEKRMREDMYYRLSSIQIKLTPLRERKSDIIDLTKYFIEYYNKEMKSQITGVTNEVMELFNSYDWPGNVRQFKNLIESAFNFTSSNVIDVDNLPEYIFEDTIKFNDTYLCKKIGLNGALEEYEKNLITSMAKDTKSLSQLAEELQISRQNLHYKINKYNLNL